MDSKLKLLVNSRKHTRKLVTECFNRRANFRSLSVIEKSTTKSKLQQHSETLTKLNEEIQSVKWGVEEDEGWLNDELDTCEEYFLKIRECLANLDPIQSPPREESARSLLKSPTAPLPTFKSHEGEDLLKFFTDFEDITSMFDYSSYDKFVLLKQQVSGRALILIDSLESDKRGYDHAKSLLTSALASTDTQTFNVIKQLSEIKLDYGSDPFEYISKIRNLTESAKKLKLDRDSFLRYFFWQGLNDSFKEQLIQITNSSKPTLKEIDDNFFEASERYMSSQKKSKISKSSSKVSFAGATNVSYKDKSSFKPCSICTSVEGKKADHPIYKCAKFSDALSKVEKLKELKGCLKCADLSHVTDKCKFRLHSRCKHCKDWHFSFLCLKDELPKSKGEKPPKGPAKETNGTLAVTEALKSDLANDSSILPTFSCKLNSGIKLRVLKDGGCQSNFITERLAESQDLRVLQDNINLTINGINVSQNYNSKLVEVPVCIGKEKLLLEALCLPSINISLKLAGLSQLVRGFQNRGYSLSDEFLMSNREVIDGFDMILGTKSSYCIPESDVVFGGEGKSVFSFTPCGVMLKGDIATLLKDLPYLPHADSKTKPLPSVEADTNCQSCNHEPNSELSFRNSVFTANVENYCPNSLDSNFSILDDEGNLISSELERATKEMLNKACDFHINYDDQVYELESFEVNDQLVKYALDNTTRDKEGRLVMPLLWNAKVAHLLGTNRRLSELILKSNFKKLQKNETHLKLMDETIREQERAGIIRRIDNLDRFLEDHPMHSFLPHMGVFKMDRETTKCRVVFLSNLCEKDQNKSLTVSHNQAIHPGPCLNQKLASAILHIRFDEKLLCFDLCKAFNQIKLNEIDANRLLFLWYRNVSRGDFSLVGFQNVRLSFGLRCSPTILLLGLYKILILDGENDSQRLKDLKKQIYSLCYMDNCGVTVNDASDLKWAFCQLRSIFAPYKFELQQFVTNDQNLQLEIDSGHETKTAEKVKLLGLQWDRIEDHLSTKPIQLNVKASTKREILSSIASQFDLFGYNCPLLNRSRLFLHDLQCNNKVGWDEKLSPESIKEWQNIAKQANGAQAVAIKRFVGRRDGTFKLFAYSDSSKSIFGTVIYILDVERNELSFVMAKNRIVNRQLENKSIPSLELQGVVLATECLLDLYKELAGPSCVVPINIVGLEVFSDSLVALSWINSYANKMSKMQKRSVFVMNRIHQIMKLCESHPVKFSFISGIENPADATTRCLSYRKLLQTNFFSGPNLLGENAVPELSSGDVLCFTVPDPLATSKVVDLDVEALSGQTSSGNDSTAFGGMEHLALISSRYSSFQRIVSVHANVLRFIHILKVRLKQKDPARFSHFDVQSCDFYSKATFHVILRDQYEFFPDLFKYFHSKEKKKMDLPNLVGQLNVYLDKDGLLRVRSKCEKMKHSRYSFPLLLAKQSPLTPLIIMDLHKKLNHAGCYSLLSELRKKFYIPHFFSVVKKTLKDCVGCRRFKERTIKLNQSPYREWRINPPQVPYRYIFMDYLGPFMVRQNGKKIKVWLLCITCMWSRAVNLKLCTDLTVREFLRAFQMHTFEYGLAEYCISDLGSQLVSASNIIEDYLKDHQTQSYFAQNGVKPIKFDQFVKGHSELGSMVEVCVKLTKRLLFGAIGNNVVDYKDFEFLVLQTVHLVNRRPVAFKESLRDSLGDEVPDPITPECLVRGYDLISVNIIPELHHDIDPEWQPSSGSPSDLRINQNKLEKVRARLIKLYQDEFIANLIHQAVDKKDRYKPVAHKAIKLGDIVLLKEQYVKPNHYPLGLVKEVQINTNGEVTGATILKGSTRELVKRHSSVIIPLLTFDDDDSVTESECSKEDTDEPKPRLVQKRKAAIKSAEKTRNMLRD